MEFEYSTAVFIGRFQPFHLGHLAVVKYGLTIAKDVIIIVGSSNAAPTIKNPFSFEERMQMIYAHLTQEEARRVNVMPVRDYFNVENYWITDVQQKVSLNTNKGDSVALLGNYKDSSSYYLKMFPQWDFCPTSAGTLNATDIRKTLFEQDVDSIKNDSTLKLDEKLLQWLTENFLGSAKHMQLCKEYSIIQSHKKEWEVAPFPPIFVTVDSVVVQSGHVLLVKRKFEPGKGLLALPGGHLKQNESLEEGALRELREETGIHVASPTLRSCIKESRVFDYPGRSLKGRVITHAYYIKLPNNDDLPEVRGNDDAERAFWLPLMDVGKRENEFFEDHFAIVNWFIGR